jgi:hypothetical protein
MIAMEKLNQKWLWACFLVAFTLVLLFVKDMLWMPQQEEISFIVMEIKLSIL